MFISKKKYNEAIEKAKREAEDRAWQVNHINRLEDNLHHRMNELEDRIIKLEGNRNKKSTGILPICRG